MVDSGWMEAIFTLLKTKYVFEPKVKKKVNRADQHDFRLHPFLKIPRDYDPNDVSIVAKTSPDSLLMLASNVVDSLPLPSPFDWKVTDVCRWIRHYGYPQYQNTIRENKIDGRKLILLDAPALSAMNIKNFHEIKHISYGIRCLFHFEMVKYFRSVSLPPENWEDTYKLYRVKTGRKFDLTRRTDLWHRMQLLRTQDIYLTHWDKLERLFAANTRPDELFGQGRQNRFYRCKKSIPPKPQPKWSSPNKSSYWKKLAANQPRILSVLAERSKAPPPEATEKRCDDCLPPCTCHWPTIPSGHTVLSILKLEFPHRYGSLFPETSAFLSRSRIHFSTD